MTSKHLLRIELLFTGFVTHYKYVPADIVKLMIMYFSFDYYLITYIGQEKMTLFDLGSGKKINLNVKYPNRNYKRLSLHESVESCWIRRDYLPIHLTTEMLCDSSIPLTNKQILSNEWIMTVKYPLLTAFLPINNDNNNNTGYNYILPSVSVYFSDKLNIRKNYIPIYSDKFPLYSKYSKKLYFIVDKPQAHRFHELYSFDFNDKNTCKWHFISKNLSSRHSAGYCMIDNDKYIGIFGGYTDTHATNITSKFSLYAINWDKPIQLQNMIIARARPITIYHDLFYKIFCCSRDITNGIESYDINSNKWNLIMRQKELNYKTVNMWISQMNPSIMFLAGYQGQNTKKLNIYEFDLRENNLNKKIQSTIFLDVTKNDFFNSFLVMS